MGSPCRPASGFKGVDEAGDVSWAASQCLTQLALHNRSAMVLQHEQRLGSRGAERDAVG